MRTNRSAPSATITPVLVYPDVRAAVAFLERASGFRERVRIGEDHRAQLSFGADGAVVVAGVRHSQVAPSGSEVTHPQKLRVQDVDAAVERACAAGAQAPMSSPGGRRPTDEPDHERSSRCPT